MFNYYVSRNTNNVYPNMLVKLLLKKNVIHKIWGFQKWRIELDCKNNLSHFYLLPPLHVFRQYAASICGAGTVCHVISHCVILHVCLQENQGTSGFPIHFLVRVGEIVFLSFMVI